FMQGQLMTSKPQCDCWGYQDITMIHTGRFAAVTDRWDYFEKKPINRYLQYRYINIDNRGCGVNHGDSGSYHPPGGDLEPAENADRWHWASGGRLDLDRTVPVGLKGLYIHPLEPMWYDYYGKDAKVALEDCFDKVTFRNEVDADQAYLLLDGLSRGYHGHWDGNSILRFTDNDRMWLCEGDYLKIDPREHNTVTVTRNATSGKPGMFSSLQGSLEAPQWGATVTRTPEYNGCDWDRHIIWHRPSDTFFLMDEFTALKPGLYDLKARFRTLGETSIDNRIWTVRQKGDEFFHLHLPGTGQLSEAPVPEDAGNFSRYEYVDDTAPQVLSHRLTTQMAGGERAVLPGLFYAQSGFGAPQLQVRRMDTSAMVTSGPLELVVGVGDFDLGNITTDARQFAFGSDTLMLNQGTDFQAGDLLVQASAPASLNINLASGRGIIESETAADITIATPSAISVDDAVVEPDDGSVRFSITPGRHTLTGDVASLQASARAAYEGAFEAASAVVEKQPEPKPTEKFAKGFQLTMPAQVTATASADLDGDGAEELIVGCVDGTTAAIDTEGSELWRHGFGAKVNALDTGDIDGDGIPEIACGVEDSHLHVLGADGSEKWKRRFETRRFGEAHVRDLHITDVEGDGELDIALICANAYMYVIDNTGEMKTTDGTEWSNEWRHDGAAVHAADCTGDGIKEILVGHEYFTRWILDFTSTNRNVRKSGVGGSKGGCWAITAADVDGDGLPEAIFGDLDGTITAAKPNKSDTIAIEVWQTAIGDGKIPHLLTGDFDGDGEPEIVVPSHSGFLAMLEADGTVKWVKYADNRVTDAAAVAAGLIARSSSDGSVGIYDAAGTSTAWWHVGQPVDLLEVLDGPGGPVVIAVCRDMLRSGTPDLK
ncbi:MAG: FG-GAP-like repeat-containing protein, partial [Armatimonadota bacterium]